MQVAFDIEKSQSLEIQLMSINGQVIQKDIVNAFSGHYSKSFDLSDLAKGVYILSIISDNGKVDKKVVLK